MANSTQSGIDESDFEFDCPKTVVNIGNLLKSASASANVPTAVDEWFSLPHPLHKKQSEPESVGANCDYQQEHDLEMPVLRPGCHKRSASSATTRTKRAEVPHTKSDLTKNTASSMARRRSVDVSSKREASVAAAALRPTSTMAKKQKLNSVAKEMECSVVVVPLPESEPEPHQQVQKVCVEMKSFSTSCAASRRSSAAPVAAPQSRAAQLEKYRLQKQQQQVPAEQAAAATATNTSTQKRSMPSRQAAELPPAKTQQLSAPRAAGAGKAGNKQASRKSSARGRSEVEEEDEAAEENSAMMALLQQHNKKFRAPVLYEPSRHSVRDVRRWERSSGLTWSSLPPEQREQANSDILALKQAAQ